MKDDKPEKALQQTDDFGAEAGPNSVRELIRHGPTTPVGDGSDPDAEVSTPRDDDALRDPKIPNVPGTSTDDAPEER